MSPSDNDAAPVQPGPADAEVSVAPTDPAASPSPDAAADAEAAERAAAAQAAAEAEAAEAAAREARLNRIMQKIAKTADFASVRDSILNIQKVSRSENAHVRALAGEISDDVAMTTKLLRLINAAFYSSAGGGNITSMQKAVALMGFQTVGMLASSLVIFERLPKGADGDAMRLEFARSQYAGLLAQEFCNSGKQLDGAFLSAQFQNLGDMLAGMHFSDDRDEIDAELTARGLQPGDPARHEAREKLARARWGMGIQDIGIEVARQWGWPESLLNGMRSLYPSDPESPAGREEYLRVLCTGTNRLSGDLMRLPQVGTPEERAEARKACVGRFAKDMAIPLGLNPDTLAERVEETHTVWLELVQALGIDLRPGAVKKKKDTGPDAAAMAAEMMRPPPKPPKPGERPPEKPAGSAPVPVTARPAAVPGVAPAAPASAQAKPTPPAPARPSAPVLAAAPNPVLAEALSSALETVSQLVLSGASAAQVLQLCIKHMHEALELQRVIVCLRDAGSGGIKGRLGLGERAMPLASLFDIPLQPPTCLFGLLTAKNADTLISDTSDPIIAQRLPAWYRQQVKAQTFVLLPMVAGPQVMGLIYGDRAEAGSLRISERELTLLKTMRNQVVMAMRMAGG